MTSFEEIWVITISCYVSGVEKQLWREEHEELDVICIRWLNNEQIYRMKRKEWA